MMTKYQIVVTKLVTPIGNITRLCDAKNLNRKKRAFARFAATIKLEKE